HRDTEYSQLMQPFSQWFPPPPSPTFVKLAPIALAQQLYATLSLLLAGEATSVHVLPVLIDYVLADVENSVLINALHVIFALIQSSSRLRQALVDKRPTTFSRIMRGTEPLHRPPVEHFETTTKIVDIPALKTKCVNALTRVLKHHVHQPSVLEYGLATVSLWASLSLQSLEPILPILQDILLSPKASSEVQVQTLMLLMDLLRTEAYFQIWARQKQLVPLVLLKSPQKLTVLHSSVHLTLLKFIDFIIMTYGLTGATTIVSHEPNTTSVVSPIITLVEQGILAINNDDIDTETKLIHQELIRTGFQLLSAFEQYVELRCQVSEPKQLAVLYFILNYIEFAHPRDAMTALALRSVLQTPPQVNYVAVVDVHDPTGTIADEEALVYYNNAEKILERFGCSTKYSLYTCDDCRDAYKYWVCAVKFQRCGGSNLKATAVCPSVDGDCNPFRTRTCLSICEDVIRKCPYVLKFDCPSEETEYFSSDISICNRLDRTQNPDNPSLDWPGTFAS
ncbi:hypothetical protein THRCLA_02140, partial [Thraustotheca clavata]